MTQIERPIENSIGRWLPPELPPDCTNVTVFFGSSGMVYSRIVAEISPENAGTKFAVKDLPSFMLTGLDKIHNYSPRNKYTWIKWDGIQQDYGATRVNLPVLPFVISNRFYVEVEIPFLNERRKVLMSEEFNSALSNIPNNWDWNYSTNYDANGGAYICEMVNEFTNPVLQVVYLAPNAIVVNGVFVVDTNKVLWAFNCPPQLIKMGSYKFINTTNGHEITDISKYMGTNTLGDVLTNALYDLKFPGERTIFKYPSNVHPGAFEDWFMETNKSVTNNLDRN